VNIVVTRNVKFSPLPKLKRLSMQNNGTLLDWKQELARFPSILENDFLVYWNFRDRNPTTDDAKAAAELHVQLVSRVATQHLPYRAGVETDALKSIYELFGHTRNIASKYPLAGEFDELVWYVLNTHVRPFAAKWHRKNQDGALDALDETDQFRSELSHLQGKLAAFDSLLLLLRDGKNHQRFQINVISNSLVEEMSGKLDFGIPATGAGVDAQTSKAMNDAERIAIGKRRKTYKLDDSTHAAGLAISGGGIRSATFALGVLVALSKRNLLPQFDYMSTVSGGGFVGSFLTAFLSGTSTDAGLDKCQHPFNSSAGESSELRHIRHKSRYLHTSTWERFFLGVAQVYGMAVNILAICLLPLLAALLEYLARSSSLAQIKSGQTNIAMISILIAGLILPGLIQRVFNAEKIADWAYRILGLTMVTIAIWWLLGFLHAYLGLFKDQLFTWGFLGFSTALCMIPLFCTLVFAVLPARYKIWRKSFALIAGLGAPLCFLSIELVAFAWLASSRETFQIFRWAIPLRMVILIASCASIFILVWVPLNINFTSPHRHYRRKLAEAFIIQRDETGALAPADIRISEATAGGLGPYHLINAALNVPSSSNSAMQGRLSDFFLFSQAYCGSPITGYRPTIMWENADSNLTLATAMAISGAAASPLMGLETKSHVAFWMAILNVRLGYWLRNPKKSSGKGRPGAMQLGREMFGKIDEHGPFLNLTDGGHIENLGVYELLRRRCKFIVAIDGEFDPNMTFHALTNLQRLASIDFDINIEIDLDELRLNTKKLSRSHFQFCRIKYPKSDNLVAGIGYMLYVKLSLTGNEGEFIRKYRMDEPEFPHHSTTNQFFSEAQFEAYRSLGEHIGEKLFIEALSGKIAENPRLSDWFEEIGKRMLDN
jgi:hypothetical protein